MTKWGAFAAWSIQIRKCWTFRLDQRGLSCAIIKVRYRANVRHAQAGKRADSQVDATDARAYLLHEPPARHCSRADAAPRRTIGVALGHPDPGMGLCAISSRRELPVATCRRTAGMDAIPNRIIEAGPYRFTRNPMYLGHLIFMIGLVITFRSWFALILLVARAIWFQRRVLHDEARLERQFGVEYSAYRGRVKRWVPFAF